MDSSPWALSGTAFQPENPIRCCARRRKDTMRASEKKRHVPVPMLFFPAKVLPRTEIYSALPTIERNIGIGRWWLVQFTFTFLVSVGGKRNDYQGWSKTELEAPGNREGKTPPLRYIISESYLQLTSFSFRGKCLNSSFLQSAKRGGGRFLQTFQPSIYIQSRIWSSSLLSSYSPFLSTL